MSAAPAPDPYADPVEFLRSLWPDGGPGFLPIWWRDTHTTEFVTLEAIEVEVPRLLDQRGTVNVYFGMGLQPSRLPGRERGTAKTVIGIPGIWADLDTQAGHSGSNGKVYPPDKESAAGLLSGLPAPPCWLVDSGNGLHAYWRLKEPWYFSHQAENLAAQRAVKGWEVLIRREAASRGWTVDAVADLARVMRLPGTINRKEGLPDALCYAIQKPTVPPVLNPSDFEAWVPDGVSVGPEMAGEPLVGGDFTIRNGASVPDLVDVLCQNDPAFKRTWERRRPSSGPGALADQSPSGYELSLCTQVVNSGIDADNQSLVDMCASFRRLREPRGKQAVDKGVKYYEGLLRKSRGKRGYKDADVVREALAEQVEADREAEVVEARETGSEIDYLRRAIPAGPDGKPIGNLDGLTRVIKRGVTDARYYLVLGETEVLVGGLKDLQDWRKFRTYLGDQLSRLIGPARRKDNEWDRIVDTMIRIADKDDLGPGGDEWEVLNDAVEDYVRSKMPPPRPDQPVIQRHAVPSRRPYIHHGSLGVHCGDFMKWLRVEEGRNREVRPVQDFLRRLLGPSVDVSARRYSQASHGMSEVVNRSYFVGPVPEYLLDLVPGTDEDEA